jgi:glycosyltransferase involved in cell wall biosynthesis
VFFSIITPSYKQLDWLRLCVASVRDQVALNAEGGNLKAESTPVDVASHFTGQENPEPRTQNFPPPLAVEHIIQDAGTPGIEDFAREIVADFYRDGKHIFSSQPSGFSPQVSSLIPQAPSRYALPATRNYRVAIYCEADGGMYDAINRGLARASGEFCAYLNCDDQYLPFSLAKVADYFKRNPKVEMVFGDVVVVDEAARYLCSRLVTIPHYWHTKTCTLSVFTAATFFRNTASGKGMIPFPTKWKAVGDAAWIAEHLQRGTKMGLLRTYLAAATETGQNLILSEVGTKEQNCFRAKRRS